jgi:hypothetical protein
MFFILFRNKNKITRPVRRIMFSVTASGSILLKSVQVYRTDLLM